MKYLRYICFLFFTVSLLSVCAQDENQNYIRTRKILTTDGTGYIDNIQYFDGLGQAYQNVQKGITPSRGNLITYQEFDAVGRDSVSWLPLSSTSDYVNFTTFKTNVCSSYDDEQPYKSQLYEHSPLNRLSRVYKAGEKWSTHPRTKEYMANEATGNLSCLLYKVSVSGQLTCSGSYPEKSLVVVKEADEDRNVVYTFTDKLGRNILTRQMNFDEPHDTYYVYDVFGNKRYVLPPMVTGTDSDMLKQYAYYYRYDSRHRCIRKKLPGCDTIRYVYDRADRLIFTQDGNQRKANQWMFRFYDDLGRELVQGICSGVPIDIGDIVITLERTSNDGLGRLGYSLPPELGVVYDHLLIANYYDDYSFLSTRRFIETKDSLSFQIQSGYGEQYMDTLNPAISAKGRLTGKLIASFPVGANNPMLGSAFYYDYKGNIIQQRKCNHLGKYDNDLYLYSFTGKVLKHLHNHSVVGRSTLAENYLYDYDHADRLKKVVHKYRNMSTVLYENMYNELCQLSNKTLHDGMEDINYKYNMHSQLESVYSTHFYQNIYYATGRYCYNGNISGIAWTSDDEKFSREYSFYYDGMSRLWSASYSQSDGGVADFSTSYNYDKMGNHTEIFRRGLVMKPDFYEYMDRLSLTYDGNHLKKVTDNGNDPLYSGTYGFVDGANLPIEYIYDKNGNLTQDYNKGIALIQYNSLNLPDTLQFSNGNAIYYVYGADGVKHRVVHQTAIPNLTVPMGSTFTPMAYQISSKTTTDYCGNIIYTDGMPDMLLTEVGYMKIRGSRSTYHYYLKDHQGNNRILIDQEGNVEQINQYYPFGGLFCDGVADGEHPYRYNGKEIDRMHGLDWYDYGSRMKTDLGFSTLDPLCEKYYSISPYAYCMNNPMRFIDPDGKQAIPLPIPAPPLPIYYNPHVSKYSDQYVMAAINKGVDATINSIENGLVLSAAALYLSYNNARLAVTPEYKHQRERDRRNREGLDLNQANVAKSIDANISGNMPNGDPAPKRGPQGGVGKYGLITGMATAIVVWDENVLNNLIQSNAMKKENSSVSTHKEMLDQNTSKDSIILTPITNRLDEIFYKQW